MNYKYTFTYRRLTGNCNKCNKSILNKNKECDRDWKSVTVIGHGPEILENIQETIVNGVSQKTTVRDSDNSRMVLYFEDGSLQVIANWKECELKLGQDWVLATKSKMEDVAGRDIKLSVGSK
jgi:hypothetical protein